MRYKFEENVASTTVCFASAIIGRSPSMIAASFALRPLRSMFVESPSINWTSLPVARARPIASRRLVSAESMR